MRIDTESINYNALRLIREAASSSFTQEDCQKTNEYIMGILDLAEALKEVLKA